MPFQRTPYICPKMETRLDVPPCPCKGGTRGYNHTQGESGLITCKVGLEDTEHIINLRAPGCHPSKVMTREWDRWHYKLGHFTLFVMSSNAPATILRGYSSFLLTLYRNLFPKATQSEISIFLYNATGPGEESCFFFQSQTTRVEAGDNKEVGLYHSLSSQYPSQLHPLLGVLESPFSGGDFQHPIQGYVGS